MEGGENGAKRLWNGYNRENNRFSSRKIDEQVEHVLLSSPLVRQIFVYGDSSKSRLAAVVVPAVSVRGAGSPRDGAASVECHTS